MTAGNGTAGIGASGSAAISAPTVVRSPSRTRRRASPARGTTIQPRLRLRRGNVVGQRPPPPLRGGVVRLLHHALAPAPPRRADLHRDTVVLRGLGERRSQVPRPRMADRGHPVEPPAAGHPAQPLADAVQRRDEIRLLLALGEHPAPPARVRQRPDQQVRVPPLAPRRGRARQLDPVPLGLLARRVIDHRELAGVPAAAHSSHRGRSPRLRSARVNDGYAPS